MRVVTWVHVVPGLYSPNAAMQAAGNAHAWVKNTLCGVDVQQADHLRPGDGDPTGITGRVAPQERRRLRKTPEQYSAGLGLRRGDEPLEHRAGERTGLVGFVRT